MHLKKQQSTQKNKTFIIVSLSSRSLAESATKTDNSVIAVDVFNDLDLLKVAKKVFKIRKEGGNNEFNNRNLLNTVRKISNKFPRVQNEDIKIWNLKIPYSSPIGPKSSRVNFRDIFQRPVCLIWS